MEPSYLLIPIVLGLLLMVVGLIGLIASRNKLLFFNLLVLGLASAAAPYAYNHLKRTPLDAIKTNVGGEWQSTADREHCLQMAAQCQIFLREIVQQEKQSERDLIEHRDDAARRQQGSHTAALACESYAAYVGALSGRRDLSCAQ